MANHKGDGFGGSLVCGKNEITLVFTVLIIDDNDELAGGDGSQGILDGLGTEAPPYIIGRGGGGGGVVAVLGFGEKTSEGIGGAVWGGDGDSYGGTGVRKR